MSRGSVTSGDLFASLNAALLNPGEYHDLVQMLAEEVRKNPSSNVSSTLFKVLSSQQALRDVEIEHTTGAERMDQKQVQQLGEQIEAFVTLSRGESLPTDFSGALGFVGTQPSPGITPIELPELQPRPLPQPTLSPAAIAAAANSAALPQALSIMAVKEDYDRRVKEFERQKIERTKEALRTQDPQRHVQHQLEHNLFELLPLQRELKEQVLSKYRQQLSSSPSLQAQLYQYRRYHHIAMDGPPVITQNYYLESMLAQRYALRENQRSFLKAVIARQGQFVNFFTQAKVQYERVLKQFMKKMERIEKQREALAQKQEKERLAALKNNDEEAYLKLLSEAKNHRLSHLLEQTDSFLRQIGALVADAKDEHQAQLVRDEQKKELKELRKKARKGDEESRRKADDLAATLKDNQAILRASSADAPTGQTGAYYTNIHKIHEEVKDQPRILTGGKLTGYQMEGLQWLVSLYNNHLNGILADEMGLGKTIQTIALLCYLFETKMNQGPFLIVAPLSTVSNWVNEFQKWAPDLKVLAFKGTPEHRKQIWKKLFLQKRYNVVVTTFDYVIREKIRLQKPSWKYIIVDEGHRMKNTRSKFTRTISQYYKSQHRLILTGTPLQNSLQELWSLLNFLLPSIFNSVDNFEQWFNKPFETTGDKVDMNEEESLLIIQRLHKVLRPFLLRRLKSEVLDQLPQKVEKVILCEMSAMQKKMYENLKTGGSVSANHRGLQNHIMQLRKVCDHPFLFPEEDTPELGVDAIWRTSGKLELLDRILPKLKATGHRVLLFSQMTQMLSILEDFCRLRGHAYLRLDGHTKDEDRGELLRQFNAPNSPYFLFMLSTRAGGLGLNLQTADTVVLFDSDWNPQMDLQAQDRAHRIGQENEVKVLRLITANSVEERILQTAQFKLGLDQKIIEAGMFNNTSQAGERHEMLIELLKEDGVKDDAEIPTDEDLNEILARSEEEFDTFQAIDEERTRFEKELGRTRLMTEAELPERLKKDITLAIKEEMARVQEERGRRDRGNRGLSLYEDMDDEEWVRMMEQQEPVKPTRTPKRKREDDDETAPAAKRLKLPPGRVIPPVSNPSPELLHEWNVEYKRILECVEDIQDEMGRVRSEEFWHLPSAEQYPDYYTVVKNPISLEQISQGIASNRYVDPQLFADDFTLMFNNARLYNAESSQIHLDANSLEHVFRYEFNAYFIHRPNALGDAVVALD